MSVALKTSHTFLPQVLVGFFAQPEVLRLILPAQDSVPCNEGVQHLPVFSVGPGYEFHGFGGIVLNGVVAEAHQDSLFPGRGIPAMFEEIMEVT